MRFNDFRGMVKSLKKNLLEKQVKKFFDCGWRLKKLKKEKDYLFISPSRNVYSTEDLMKGELYTFYDFSTMKEREKAAKFCRFLLGNLYLLEIYKEFIEQ
jgi:hypothetical protein